MACWRPRCRCGLTLVELLVMIALMAILIGLLVPAVFRFREASDRLRCAQHLQQLGTGFHRFHEVHGYLPDGGKNQCDPPYHPLMPAALRSWCDEGAMSAAWIGFLVPYTPPGPPSVRRSEWSWPYQILPYIGQDDLYQSPLDRVILRTPLAVYHCPTRRYPRLYGNHNVIDYAGCAGSSGSDGVVLRRGLGPLSLAAITDGLSNTMMIGEKRLRYDRFGLSYDDNESWANPGWDTDIYRRAWRDPDRPDDDLGPSRDLPRTDPIIWPDPNTNLDQFGASHPSGMNAVAADGSVRFIRFNPSAPAFRGFCVRNDADTSNLTGP